MDTSSQHSTGGRDQKHPKEKKCKKAKWLSEEALQMAEEEGKQKARGKRKDILNWMQSSRNSKEG